MSQTTETIAPGALSPELQREDTQRLMAQSALLLAEVTPTITEGDALLASSQEDANKQLQAAEQVATANATEKAKKETEIAAKLETVLSAPEVDLLGTTIGSVLEMRRTGIDDASITESLAKDGIILKVVETPKKKLQKTPGINREKLPSTSANERVDGFGKNAEQHVSVSMPGYELSARVIHGAVFSHEGAQNYRDDFRRPISTVEYSLQVGEDFVVSDGFNDGIVVDDMHGSRVQLSGEDASAVGAHLPSKQMQWQGNRHDIGIRIA